MTDDEKTAEELLGETANQRFETEASDAQEGDESTPLGDAITESYEEIDAGRSQNLTLRDDDLAALVFGLEASGDLDDVHEALADKLGADPEKVTRASVLRMAVRVGLRDAVPETVQTAREAKSEYESESAF